MYPLFLMTLMNKETFLAFGYHHHDFIITEIIYILFSHIIAYVNIKCLSWTTCDLTTGTVQCDYSPDLLALYLPLYQHWSPLSSTLKKNKYSSWYGIHKGNFLQLNTTINKCSYQGIDDNINMIHVLKSEKNIV